MRIAKNFCKFIPLVGVPHDSSTQPAEGGVTFSNPKCHHFLIAAGESCWRSGSRVVDGLPHLQTALIPRSCFIGALHRCPERNDKLIPLQWNI
jgi:hypothetical protein